MNYKKFVVPVLAVLVAVFLVVGYSKAADQTTISVSPVTFDLSGNPGDSLTNELLIRNSGKEPLLVNAEVQDFVATGEEGDISLRDNNATYSLSSWVVIDRTKFTLEGGQQKRVPFMIRIPFNAEPGGHYASIYAQVSPTLNNAQSGSGVGQKIGSLVLLKVSGNAKESASVESFNTTEKSYPQGPVKFDIRIKNDGTVHIRPKGIIAVTNIWGKKIADIPVDQKSVLPGAVRHMTAEWGSTPKFGKFTATLLSYYGADNKQLTEATTFWIIPWKTIIIWTLVIILLILVLWLGRHRIQRAAKALMTKK